MMYYLPQTFCSVIYKNQINVKADQIQQKLIFLSVSCSHEGTNCDNSFLYYTTTHNIIVLISLTFQF